MKVITKGLADINEPEDLAIRTFLESHLSTVFHEPSFNQILSEVFGTEFAYEIAVDGEENIIGICPVHTIKQGALRQAYSGLGMYDVPYGGWIYDRELTRLPELLSRMRRRFNAALSYSSMPLLEPEDYSFLPNKREFQTGIIDLFPSVEEIFQASIDRKRRQDIERAARKGVEVVELSQETFGIFLDQCRQLKQSIGSSPFPDDFFIRLFQRYSEVGQIVALATRLNGEYLGSGILIGNRHMTHLWIAGKPKTIPASAPRQDSLLWESIKWAKAAGSRYYDLCVVEAERLPHIAQFKLSFSKRLVPFFHFTDRKMAYRVISKIQRWLH